MSRKQQSWFDQKPVEVNGQLATRTEFYKEELYKIIKGCFKFKCPDEWFRDYVLNMIITKGYFCITRTNAGVIPLTSSVYGQNYAHFPTKMLATIPVLDEEIERELRVNAEIVYLDYKNTRTFYNFNNLVDITAEKLASCDCGIDVNVMNSRLAYLVDAETKGQANTIKAIFDKITNGDPLVVYRDGGGLSKTPLQLFFNNLRQNFIAPDLFDTKQQIYYEFYTYLGVNNANTDKKERLITDEVNANNEQLEANTEAFIENLDVCNRRVHKMFPELDFSLEWRFDRRRREKEYDVRRNATAMGDTTPK